MKMKKNEKIELRAVACTIVQISENDPRSKKFGHPCSTLLVSVRLLREWSMVLFLIEAEM